MPGDTPRVVYVLGAGRSGTTLLDIVLGNAAGAVSAGELLKYFPRDGEPVSWEGMPVEREAFWAGVRQRLEVDLEAARRAATLDQHSSFFGNLLGVAPGALAVAHGEAQGRLYQAVADQAGAEVVIDSSKYPARLLALLRWGTLPVSVVFIRRRLRDVVRSFAKRDIEQPSKSTVAAVAYWLVANAMAVIAYWRAPREARVAVTYEGLVRDPPAVLRRIAAATGLALNAAQGAYRVGPLFEGNRLRQRETVTIEHRAARV